MKRMLGTFTVVWLITAAFMPAKGSEAGQREKSQGGTMQASQTFSIRNSALDCPPSLLRSLGETSRRSPPGLNAGGGGWLAALDDFRNWLVIRAA